jgi:hypothetical protein
MSCSGHLPPPNPNIILKLLELVHFLQNLDLLVFPDLSRLILVQLK